MSQWTHRLLAVVPLAPAAQFTALRTWWTANVVEAGDGPDDPATWPGLNPTGLAADPVTHRWWSAALKDTILKAVLLKACQLGAVTPPTNVQWTGWTQPQKVSWLVSVRDALYAACGIWLDLCRNDGGSVWNDPRAALTRVGVKVRQ